MIDRFPGIIIIFSVILLVFSVLGSAQVQPPPLIPPPIISPTPIVTVTPTPTPAPTPVSCPSGCMCLSPAEIANLGYGLCGGSTILCGYDQQQNEMYCYEPPPMTVQPVPTTPVMTAFPSPAPTVLHPVPTTPVPLPVPTIGPTPAQITRIPVSATGEPSCLITGKLFGFQHNPETLSMRVQEVERIGGSCDPFYGYCLEGAFVAKEGVSPRYFDVEPVYAGDLLSYCSYRAVLPCTGIYQLAPVYQAEEGECEWRGDWIPAVSNHIEMNSASLDGYDFTFRSSDNRVPEIDVIPGAVIAPSTHRGEGNWELTVSAADPGGIQKIMVHGNYTVEYFESDESGPLQIRTAAHRIPVSQDCDAATCTIAIPYYEHGKRISFDLRIAACDGVGNAGGMNYRASFPEETGDLIVQSIEPVQVLYGAPLVKDKGTAFRVRVASTFPCPVETKFRLILPANQWGTIQSTGNTRIELPPDWRYPEIWGPVKIPANARDFEIMLPVIPEWQKEEDYSPGDYAGRMIRGERIGSVYGPDVRIMPKPIAERVTFGSEIDPDDSIAESNEGNNRVISGTNDVITTRGYRFAVFRVIGGVNERGCPYNLASVPSFADVDDGFKKNLEYLLGTFPVSEEKVSYTIMPNTDIEFDIETTARSTFLTGIYRLARSEYDWAVGVTCGCCGGTCSWSTRSVLIGTDAANFNNLAHEASHIDTVADAPDCYGCGESDVDCLSCRNDEGFWVNAWEYYPRLDPPSDWTPDRGDWETNVWLRQCYYMDFSNYAPYCWQRLDPVLDEDGTWFEDGFLNMIQNLEDERDPEGLLVSGMIYRNGTAHIDPFMRIPKTTIDLERGTTGEYSIVLFDEKGTRMGSFGFDVSFRETAYPPATGMIELDHMSFVYMIEWLEGTRRIEIQDRSGSPLATRTVSANNPEITIITPNGGEKFEKSASIPVRWESTDIDGDLLTSCISVSPDGGVTWIPYACDVEESEYAVSTETLDEGDAYLVKVSVTDGVNTAADVSNAVFSIGRETKTQVGSWIMSPVVGIVALLFVLWRRGKIGHQ